MKKADKRKHLGRHISVTLPGRRVYFSVYGQEAVEYDRLTGYQKLRYAQVRGNRKSHDYALKSAKSETDRGNPA